MSYMRETTIVNKRMHQILPGKDSFENERKEQWQLALSSVVADEGKVRATTTAASTGIKNMVLRALMILSIILIALTQAFLKKGSKEGGDALQTFTEGVGTVEEKTWLHHNNSKGLRTPVTLSTAEAEAEVQAPSTKKNTSSTILPSPPPAVDLLPWNFTDIVIRKQLARAFPAKFNKSLLRYSNITTHDKRSESSPKQSVNEDGRWCTHRYDGKHPTGLLYPKIPKTATSPIAGVAYRVAKNYGERHFSSYQKNAGCDVIPHHIQHYGVGKKYSHRIKDKSFLISSIRDPANRALSRVFFEHVSRLRKKPTDQNVMKWLNITHNHRGAVSPGMGGFQLAYLSLTPIEEYSAWNGMEPTKVRAPEQVEENVRRLLNDYDFLVVVERLEESIVVWQLLMGLETSDMLYISSKRSGASYFLPDPKTHHGKVKKSCYKLEKSIASEAVSTFLRSEEWYAKNYGDYLMLEAANQSLDLTIDQIIGRERFERALKEYRKLSARAHELCESTVIFPCDDEGYSQWTESQKNCYNGDQGCGYPCLDSLL